MRKSATLVGLVLLGGLTGLWVGVPASARTLRHHRHHRHRHHHHRRSRGCAYALTPARNASSYLMQAAILCLLNRDRNAYGLPSLAESRALDSSAQGWATFMIRTHQFTHGANFAARISASGYVWQTAGENIATGFGTPRGVVTAWMASPDHCRNILSPTFRNIGMGEAPVSVGGRVGAATWVTDFGRHMGQRPASSRWGPADGCPY